MAIGVQVLSKGRIFTSREKAQKKISPRSCLLQPANEYFSIVFFMRASDRLASNRRFSWPTKTSDLSELEFRSVPNSWFVARVERRGIHRTGVDHPLSSSLLPWKSSRILLRRPSVVLRLVGSCRFATRLDVTDATSSSGVSEAIVTPQRTARSKRPVKQFVAALADAPTKKEEPLISSQSSGEKGFWFLEIEGGKTPPSSSDLASYMESLNNASVKTEEINEGSASLLVPAGNQVFYNPVQNVNRDVSILALDVFAKQLKLEHDARETMRLNQQPGWRKLTPTWDFWGLAPTTTAATTTTHGGKEADEDAKEAGDDEQLQNKKRVKLEGDSEATAATNTPATRRPMPETRRPFELRILEALAASGLRSIRYAKEIAPLVPKKIIANDLSASACASITSNAARNGPYSNGTTITASHSDAVDVMMKHRKPTSTDAVMGSFEVVDLDPYGSPSVFLDGAVQSVVNGGVLCVTATDLAILAGTNPEKCHSKYGCMPIHRPYGHEMALRIVLASIESAANRFGRHIVPQLSLKLDFYVRVFVRVYDSAAEVKKSPTRLAHVYQSKGCDTYHVVPLAGGSLEGRGARARDGANPPPPPTAADKGQPSRLPKEVMRPCDETGQDWMVGGPIWCAPTNNPAFIDACLEALDLKHHQAHRRSPDVGMVLKYRDRVQGILAAVRNELHDVPLYMSTSSIFRTIHTTQAPLERIQAALVNAGYEVSQVHHDPQSIKTTAPCAVVWDIVRCWVARTPTSSSHRMNDPKSVASIILSKKPTREYDFDPPKKVRDARRRVNKNELAQMHGLSARPKWEPNPQPNWGPKSRASAN